MTIAAPSANVDAAHDTHAVADACAISRVPIPQRPPHVNVTTHAIERLRTRFPQLSRLVSDYRSARRWLSHFGSRAAIVYQQEQGDHIRHILVNCVSGPLHLYLAMKTTPTGVILATVLTEDMALRNIAAREEWHQQNALRQRWILAVAADA